MADLITQKLRLDALRRVSKYPFELDLWASKSASQLQQEIFALVFNDFKRGGFFVEFGATNGMELSNTFLLEKEFGWSGILAEPCRNWYPALIQNRNCIIDHRCVWVETGQKLLFNETLGPQISTIDTFSNVDFHGEGRKNGKKYEVNTISLVDLLSEHSAPSKIDYLSIDTEGSEFEILQAFPFGKYTFNTITCEHNFSPFRGQINSLLLDNGYRRVLQEFSEFDDWYVLDARN